MKKVITVLLCCITTLGYTQSKSDSLLELWKNVENSDSTRLKSLRSYLVGLKKIDMDSALNYAMLGLEYASSSKNEKEIARYNFSVGNIHHNVTRYTKATEYYNLSLNSYKKADNLKGVSDMFNNIGICHYEQGHYDSAIVYYQKALEGRLELKDLKGIGGSYINIGIMHMVRGDNYNAIDYMNKGVKICEEHGFKDYLSNGLNNIGAIYKELQDFDNAEKYHLRAIELAKERGDSVMYSGVLLNLADIKRTRGLNQESIDEYRECIRISEAVSNYKTLSLAYHNLGIIYTEEGLYEKGRSLYDSSIVLSLESNSKYQLSLTYNMKGKNYFEEGEQQMAELYYKKSADLAFETGSTHALENIAFHFYRLYKQQNKPELALEQYEKYISIRDSVKNESTDRAMMQHEFRYTYEKKAASDSIKAQEEIKVQKAENKRDKLEVQYHKQQGYLLYGGLGLALLFGVFIFNRFRVASKQKSIIEKQKQQVDLAFDELEEKNTEIMDSIAYAKRIQSAILPPTKLVKEYLHESFILYKPKDVVAGDFYWMEPVKGKILFASADCTGHGVPGAMVSVICNGGLNRSVREYGLTDPGKILDKTREIVIQEFEKSEEEVKDGMDIALCSLEGNKLQYAGANNPLWIIRNGEIIETKADKQPIGKYTDPKPFMTHTIELQKEDSIYIFSDGYVDQFGGEKGKKFKPPNFRKLLLSIQDNSMEKQQELLDEAFEEWRGDLEQIDDVCVIGVRI
ncbi:MAG: serine phosphatase RsbU (regulator of sigma subunit) [Parvicellaceae bacterium]|jgi:serine phosphatase RsbU (regulator of sigma subunit)